jgi:hypothetical protein
MLVERIADLGIIAQRIKLQQPEAAARPVEGACLVAEAEMLRAEIAARRARDDR